MKARMISAAVAVSGLMAVSGAVLADAHDGYQRAFYGDSGTVQIQAERSDAMGKAAYGSAMGTPAAGPKGGIIVLTTNGLGRWVDSSSESASGKAAFGTGSSGTETALNNYHRAFYGD